MSADAPLDTDAGAAGSGAPGRAGVAVGAAQVAPPEPVGLRTSYCGTLRASDAGREVTVCGWVARRREHGEHLAFVDVRDHTGLIQCVVDGAHELRSEFVVRVTGTVRARPEGTVNPALATGEVELGDCERRGAGVGRAAAVRPRRQDGDRRGGAPALPLHRPAVRADAAQPPASGHGQLRVCDGRWSARASPRSRRRCSGRRRRRARGSSPIPSRLQHGSFYVLPQSPQIAKQLLDGRRLRPLLPDRPVHAGRGPACRPPVRVHPARPRGVVRHRRTMCARSSPRPSLDATEAVTGERPARSWSR